MSEQEQPPQMPVGLDVYKPKERLIYRYFDGEKDRVVDPIVLYKRVIARAPELDADLKAANFPGFNKAEEAYDGLIKKLQKIFGVKPLEEGGLTPTELEGLLDHFLNYCDWVKKNSRTIATYATETSVSTDSLSTESQPTSNTLDSGSTEKESSTEKPKPSPSAPASQQAELTQAWRIGEISLTETDKPK